MRDDREDKKRVLSNKITLYKRIDSPFWHYYFRVNKNTFRGTTHLKNFDESEEFCILKYNEIKNSSGKIVSKKTFKQCVDHFFEKRSKKIKKNTLSGYKVKSRFLLEYFKHIDPNAINAQVCSAYKKWRVNYYIDNPKRTKYEYKQRGNKVKSHRDFKVSDVTASNELGLLINILKFCHDDDYIIIMRIPHIERSKGNSRDGILEKHEYLKLKEYFLMHNPYYWLIISFVQNTGLRYPSELNELKWKDIHLDKDYMDVRNRKGKLEKKKVWSVPLVGTSKSVIEKLKNRDVPTGPEDYVFVKDKDRRIINITRSFKKALIECEINKPLSMYSLRHTYATRMVSTRPDIPLKILAESMGHTSVQMIEKHYGHLQPEHLVKFFQRSEAKKQVILNGRKQDQSETQLDESNTDTTTHED